MAKEVKVKLTVYAVACLGLLCSAGVAFAEDAPPADAVPEVPAGVASQETESAEAPVVDEETLAQSEGDSSDAVAADDDEESDAEVTESVDEEEEGKSWGVGASTGISVGIGSFVPEEEGGRPRVRWRFGINGHYTIPVIDVTVSADTGFSQWLTRGGGSQTVQEFRWADTGLSLSRSIWEIPVVDIAISGGLGFTLPTSRYSQQSNLYTTIAPSLSFGWSLGGFSLGYSLSYFHNFHEYTSVTYDPNEVDILSRSAGAEIKASDAVADGGVLTEFGVSNSFNVGYRFLDDFSVGLGFGFSDSWSYDNGTITQDDAFVAENADVGRAHSQGTSGSLRFGYTPIEFLSLSLSLTSGQPWKTADNKGYRFPFFDFESPTNNYTNINFGLSGRY